MHAIIGGFLLTFIVLQTIGYKHSPLGGNVFKHAPFVKGQSLSENSGWWIEGGIDVATASAARALLRVQPRPAPSVPHKCRSNTTRMYSLMTRAIGAGLAGQIVIKSFGPVQFDIAVALGAAT